MVFGPRRMLRPSIISTSLTMARVLDGVTIASHSRYPPLSLYSCLSHRRLSCLPCGVLPVCSLISGSRLFHYFVISPSMVLHIVILNTAYTAFHVSHLIYC